MDEKVLQEIQQITKKMQSIQDEYGAQSAEYKSYVEKADQKFEAFEKLNKEFNEKYEAEKNEKEELKDRVKTLELLGTMSAHGGAQDVKKDVNEVMNALLKKGWSEFINDPQNEQKAQRVFGALAKRVDQFHETNEASKTAMFVKNYGEKASGDLLRSDIGEYGGFLCPEEWSAELNKNLIEYGPVRRYARVKRTGSKVYKEPIRVGIPTAQRPGEAETSTNGSPNYAMNDFTPVRLTHTVGVTWDELNFNGYDLASEILRDVAEAFAVREGAEFFNGDGANKGVGWTVDANVPEFTTATATLTFDDMINITGELKRGYDPMYMFNRQTLAYLRTLKDAVNGRYLWNPAFGDAAGGAPATINGYRYSADFIEFDEYTTATGFPVLFADMPRFYQFVDRTDMTIIRDEYSRKKEGVVEFTMNKWCFGKPKIHEAGVRMKMHA